MTNKKPSLDEFLMQRRGQKSTSAASTAATRTSREAAPIRDKKPSLDEFLSSRRQRPNDTMQGRGPEPLLTEYLTHRNVVQREKSNVRDEMKRTLNRLVNQMGGGLDGEVYQQKLQRALDSGKSIDQWFEEAERNVAAAGKTGSEWHRGDGFSGRSGKFGMDPDDAQRDLQYATVAKQQQDEWNARKRAQDAGLSPEDWYQQAKAAVEAEDERTAKAEKGSFWQSVSEAVNQGNIVSYAAAREEGEPIKAELDAARGDRTMAMKDLEYARRAYWESLPERADFAEGVEKGKADPGNKVEEALKTEEKIRDRGRASTNKLVRRRESQSLMKLHLDATEGEIYHYLLGTKGERAAEEYLKDMQETINYREGVRLADLIEAESGGVRLALEIGQAGSAGLENAATGLAQIFSRDAIPTSATAFASQETRKNIEQHDGPELLGHSVEGIAYDATNTMANMAPSLAIGTFNPIAGAAVMGAQSKGQAYQQALKQGYTRGQAEQYSVAVGAAEAGLSYVLGGISQMGGISQFTGKMTQRIGNGWLRAGVELGIDVLGENTEEYLQNKLEPLLRNTIFGENNEISLWDEEDAYTVLLTTMTTGLLNAGNTISTAQIGKVGQQFRRNGQVDKLLELAQNFDAAPEVQELAAAMQRGETPKNAMNIGELAVAYDRAGGDMSALIHTERAGKADRSAQRQKETATQREQGSTQRELSAEREDLPQPIREELARNAATLGEDAKIVMAAYHSGRDINHYTAAMDAAINLYAAQGAKKEALYNSSLARELTEDQIDAAWEVGRRKYEQKLGRAKTQQDKAEVQNIQPGRVSYDGAIIDGKEYGGVKRQNMSRAQRAQVEASAVVAKALGLELSVYYGSRDGGVQGAYQSGRVIYLNVNAGQEVGETLIVNAFSHELTHFAEEYGGDAYESLRSFVVDTLAEGDQQKFEQLVTAKMESQGLDYDRAISEVVADGCEMMLRDSEAPALLAERNPTLFNQVAKWISEWVEKIKAAFQGVNARHEEARMLLDSAQELQKLWDSAITAAVENSEAQKTAEAEGNKKTAEAGGEVQYSIETTEDGKKYVKADRQVLTGTNPTVWAEQLTRYINKNIRAGKDVALNTEDGNILLLTATTAEKGAFRNVIYDKNDKPRVYTDEEYAAKLNAEAHIDELVKVSKDRNPGSPNKKDQNNLHGAFADKGWRYRRAFFQDFDGRYYQLTVSVASGTGGNVVYNISEMRERNFPTPKGSSNNSVGARGEKVSFSEKNIPQSETDVNTQHSESEGSVTDRQLLSEAAEREGAKDILRGYKKKADNLDMYQRRLERQQKKLENSELSDGERAAVRERITETERLIENTQRAMQQMERRPDMQHIAKEERARWWSENMGDAVETSRRLQKENTELKEAVDYYRAQAKRTAPENRRVDAADVRRFARALVKEHGSSADVKELSAQIQKIGDMLVSEDGGAGLSDRRLRQEARAAARMVIDEVYRDANEDNAPLRREIAERVRGTRLQISDELRGDMTDFNQWRKSQLGRFTLVKEDGRAIDSFYEELSVDFGEGLFPQNITAQADQLQQIHQVLDHLAPDSSYAFSEYGREAMIGIVSEEILDTIISGDIRQAETMADRNYRIMQETMLEAKEGRLAAEKEAARAVRRADNAERNALRQVREEQKAITREKVKSMRQQLNESREAQQKRINIERSRSRLSRMLRENSKTKHLPEALRGEIGKLLLSIDTLGPFSEGTKSEARYRDELQQIQQTMQNIVVSNDLAEVYGDMELTDGVKVMLQNNVDTVKAAIGEGGEKVTRKMGLKELKALEESLTIIETACRNMNELLTDGEHRFAHMDELAASTIKENAEIKEKALRIKGTEKAQELLEYDNMTPFYYFKRMGAAAQEIYQGILAGQGKVARLEDRVVSEVQDIYREHKMTSKEIRDWEKHENSIMLVPATDIQESTVLSGEMNPRNGEETVYLTDAQAMNVYLLSKREQGRSHLYGTGIKISPHKTKGVFERSQGKWYTLMPEDVAKITSMLSEKQIAVADAMGKYLDAMGKEMGNEISRKLYGIDLYAEKNYWPIETDSDSRGAKTDEASESNLYRLASPGFSKKTVRDAKNAAVIDSVFDVFAKHSEGMINYNALALPLLDAKRYVDYQSEGTSVQQSIRTAHGDAAVKYFIDLLKAMNGGADVTRGGRNVVENAYSKLMSNVKVSLVGNNIRVIVQQPTSMARAGIMIDQRYIAKGILQKGGLEKALKYSDLALWKHNGHYDTNISRSIAADIKGTKSMKEKFQDFSLKGAEFGDALTLGALWNACELETRDKTGLAGEDLMKATVKRYEDVLLGTQVIDGVLQRSPNMRSKSVLMKELTSFKAEPTLAYNILLDLKSEIDKEVRTNGWNAAKNKMFWPTIKTLTVWAETQAILAIAQAAADAGRDDDDYETWLQKFSQHWKKNFADNMNPLTWIPVVDDLITVITNKDKDLLGFLPFKQIRTFYEALDEKRKLKSGELDRATKATGYGKRTDIGIAYMGLQAISSLSGAPISGIARETLAGYNLARTLWNDAYGNQTGKTLRAIRIYDPGPEKEIRNAWEQRYLTEEETIALLISEGVVKNEREGKKTIYGWQIDGTAAYKAVKAAACSGDDKGFHEAMDAMTAAGYTESDVYTEVKKALKVQYQQPESGLKLSKAYCIDYLIRYAGMDRGKAEALAEKWTCYVVTGIQYDDIAESYYDGEITKARAQQLHQKFGGGNEEDAKIWADHIQFIKENPAYSDISDAMASKYYSMGKPASISPDIWYRFWSEAKDFTSDENGTKKDKVIDLIDSLELTEKQKDVLYYERGYAETKISETPWHK